MTLTKLSLSNPEAVVIVMVDGQLLISFSAIALQRLGSGHQVPLFAPRESL
jgi:hypothetical protein